MRNLGSFLSGLGSPCRWNQSLPHLHLTVPNDPEDDLEEFQVYPGANPVIRGSGPGHRVAENGSSSKA